MMKHIAGWFRRSNTLMAQAKDLARQLQEAWDELDALAQGNTAYAKEMASTRKQLHRVARERDKERHLKMVAEWDIDIMADSINQLLDAVDQERELRLAAEDGWKDWRDLVERLEDISSRWENLYLSAEAEELCEYYLENEEE